MMDRMSAREPALILSSSDMAEFSRYGRLRSDGKLVDRTVYLNATDLTSDLNALGVCGEVLAARHFSIPWFQEPDPKKGDSSRVADLELRDGRWLEVKTTRGRGDLVSFDTDRGRWDFAMVVRRLSEDRNGRTRTSWLLNGVMTHEQWIAGRVREKSDSGKGYWRCRMPGDGTHRLRSLAISGLLQGSEPSGGHGLRCPWCYELWPCADEICADCRQRRMSWARVMVA